MEKPILFMLNTWSEEGDRLPFYCPDCAVVEGFFAYSPAVKAQIDIVRVDYPKPRQKVVECLGEGNQGCPVLVFPKTESPQKGAKVSAATGRAFIDDPKRICHYLGKTFNGAMPH